jgi:hypothetical protein
MSSINPLNNFLLSSTSTIELRENEGYCEVTFRDGDKKNMLLEFHTQNR